MFLGYTGTRRRSTSTSIESKYEEVGRSITQYFFSKCELIIDVSGVQYVKKGKKYGKHKNELTEIEYSGK